MVISIMMSIFGLRIKENRMKKAMDVILKKATLCLLLGGDALAHRVGMTDDAHLLALRTLQHGEGVDDGG